MFTTNKIKPWHVLVIILAVLILVYVAYTLFFSQRTTQNTLLVDSNQPINTLPNNSSNSLPNQLKDFFGKIQLKESADTTDNLKLDILLDTQNTNIVVAAAKIIYDPQIFELQKIIEDNSDLNMSIIKEEQAGQILIVRGAPGDSKFDDADDGYTGMDGQLASLEFKVLDNKKSNIAFDVAETKMIVDNGQGTPMQLELIGYSN